MASWHDLSIRPWPGISNDIMYFFHVSIKTSVKMSLGTCNPHTTLISSPFSFLQHKIRLFGKKDILLQVLSPEMVMVACYWRKFFFAFTVSTTLQIFQRKSDNGIAVHYPIHSTHLLSIDPWWYVLLYTILHRLLPPDHSNNVSGIEKMEGLSSSQYHRLRKKFKLFHFFGKPKQCPNFANVCAYIHTSIYFLVFMYAS